MGSTLTFDDKLVSYVEDHTPKEPEIYARLRKETADLGSIAEMQISWIQARFMQMLVRLMHAKSYLEVGVFTGYSTMAVAEALPEKGSVTALDVSEEWTNIAKRYWAEAGVANKINLTLEDGNKALRGLIYKDYAGTYDLAFIDADKRNLQNYFDACLELVRSGGLVIVDNVLWSGDVINPKDDRDNTKAIRKFNTDIKSDERVFYSMVPVGDGLILAQKK